MKPGIELVTMKKVVAAILAAALWIAGGANAADSLTMADFVYTNKLMVAGYTGSETLENFPVLVRISTSLGDFQYSKMRSTKGGDLAFFAADGTRLASEVDTWDTGGTSLVWVKLPGMAQGTKFYVCYRLTDELAALDTMVENDNPWGDYVGVWHLKETGGASKTVYDSTANALDGLTYAGATVSAGAVGAGRTIAPDNNHAYGIVVEAASGDKKTAADELGTDFSASFWMQANGSASDVAYNFLIDRRKGEQGKSWGVRLHANGSKQLEIYAADEKPYSNNYDGTLTKANYADLYDKNTGWNKVDIHWRYATNGNVPVSDIYLNGAFVEQLSLTNIPAQVDANIGIGGSTQDTPANNNTGGKGRRFKGNMDEVRLRAGVLSADWVKADYDTVNNASFVTLAPPSVFTVEWSDADGETPGLKTFTHKTVTFAGTVLSVGDDAESCDIQYRLWADGESEPAEWTTLADVLAASAAFEVAVPGLAPGTTYRYALRAVNGVDDPTATVTGSFTTLTGLTVAWSDASGVAGFERLSYGFAVAGGQVALMGDSTRCSILCKVWPDGEAEPDVWTTLAQNLVLGSSFSETVSDLEMGTAYRYKFMAVGDGDEETSVLAGTFTTLGDEGETVGSDYTHFFDDGTNAVWVVNDFERYLPFTVTGYTGTETLTNFPVLVEVRAKDTNGFSYDDFYHYDGADIAFVDEKGHIIPHEIDTWNKNGMSMFWVRLPEMNNGTTFTMCYRSPLLETRPDPGNVFEKYVGVWHMNETKDGVVNLKDSTVNDFETETHALSTADGNGRIGYARRVAQSPGSAASYGRIIAFDHDDILRTGVGNVFTFSGWYKLAAVPPKWGYLVARKSEDADRGWGVQYEETWSERLRVWSGSNAKSAFQLFDTPGADATGWNYWTFVFDGSVNPDGTTNQLFHAFLNGEELVSTSTNGGFRLNFPIANDATAAYDNLCVVGQQNGTGAFNGLVDEARYSKGIRSADWIKAEYDSSLQAANWNNAAKRFVTKGTVSRGTDSLVPVVVWERGAGLPDTILDVSYAYVQFAGTVTYCGSGADDCRIEYQIWVDGEQRPEAWTTLASGLTAGRYFSIPVTGLKQDMLYDFSIRAVNEVDGQERQNHEHEGQFRTHGNMELGEVDGDLFRVGDRFVHRYRAGSWIFTTPDYVTNIEILVVGGGGAGGYKVGGGGGGGGLFHSESFPVSTSTVYRINVGQGGIAASNLTERSENGELSYFALASDEEHPLIRMHGGGGGGSYVNNEAIAKGADGASGGGGSYAFAGGVQAMMGLPEEFRPFGHVGGRGNDKFTGGSIGKVAAGGGGGAGRAGLGATFDTWSTGGSGGVGVGNSMTGETLYYGAGGGGGYIYRMAGSDADQNFTKPGAGGSGIGGNAADVRNGTPATSGVPNTGAGGGGGSSSGSSSPDSDSTYWQGGNGGDGVVLIAYEAHGRDPISDEPRITMVSCDYTDEKGYADIAYRAYWAGIQAQTNDIYVLYSTVSEEDVAAGNGDFAKVVHGSIGMDKTTFTPPAVGYTYYVRLVARKDANSFMYSDEIASFEVPAIRLNGATWHMPASTDDNNDPSQDYASVFYSLYDTDPDAHLYCYWSETKADLEGDAAPTGASVHFLDLGTGMANHDGTFIVPATEGLERNKTYYIRLATGNDAGTKYFLSHLILKFETIDKPRVIFPEATWENHRTTIEFLLTTAHLDPADVDFYALYGSESGVKAKDPFGKDGISAVDLGKCSSYPDDVESVTQFPLWSPVDTNYWVRLALVTNGVPVCYSQRSQHLDIISHVPPNTLLVYVNADAKIGCYGDEPQAPTYTLSYGGSTEGPGWDHWVSEAGHLTGAPSCDVTATSPSGQYDIAQGTLALSNGGATYHVSATVDEETGEVLEEEAYYYYELIYTKSRYVVTNAQFTATIADARTIYTGEDFNVTELDTTVAGIRNDQPVSYMYRVGTNDWASTITTTYSDIWTHIVQFKATAPNHDEVRGTFMITVDPAPLSATISAEDLNYLGVPQVPDITTNVTGLVRPDLNPLVCEFRDESDEWRSDVPAFTVPGTYKLFFRVSAPNHTAFMTNCTFTVREWDYWVNMDGKDGFKVPINISDPAWLLRATGRDAAYFADNTDNNRYKILDSVCANGLKLWQNYMIDREDLSRKLVAAVRQSGDRVDANSFVVYFPSVSVLRNTGLNVGFRVDRKLKGESGFTKGKLSDKYEMNVPLGPADPTGLYVFNIVLTPTNNAATGEAMYGGGEAVLSSVATVGVIRASSALTNTVTVAPWRSMTVGTEELVDVSVSDVVNPNSGIVADDMILSYNSATSNFNVWARSDAKGGEWNPLTTVTKKGLSVATAASSRFAPGRAFWLVRSAPSPYIYLVGRYVGGSYTETLTAGTEENPGYTLCGNPLMSDVDLNEFVFLDDEGRATAPGVTDRIVVETAAGVQMTYFRNAANTVWGRNVSMKVNGRTRNNVWREGGSIPAGTGFWYMNRSGRTFRLELKQGD